jgi:hypothetical protein
MEPGIGQTPSIYFQGVLLFGLAMKSPLDIQLSPLRRQARTCTAPDLARGHLLKGLLFCLI